MGYLDKNGLSRLWSKIKSYVTNHHMDVSTSRSPSGLTNLQFGGIWSNPNLYATGATDNYGHTTTKVEFPGFTLPTVECGTFNVSGSSTSGTGSVIFSKLKNIPKIIKVQVLRDDQYHSGELCCVWYDGDVIFTVAGNISSVTKTGFKFAGLPGEHYWEAWG